LAIFLLVAACFSGNLSGQQNDARLDAVRKYVLETDYPEVFGTDHYKTRIDGVLDADIENDGSKEVVILFRPHYLQSAPILIYKVSSDLKVTRLTEGLAPGPIQPISGDYLDSHNLGMAVDFTFPKGSNTSEGMLKVAAKNGMNGLVVYDSFVHMDGRKGLPAFIDMRGIKVPSKQTNCSSFEFSPVKQIAAGHIQEDATHNYLAAWVGGEIYVYLIHGASDQGLLDKTLKVIPAPKGFGGFIAGQGLSYKTDDGTSLLTLR
jgi:hypothetical protein